MFWLIPLQNLFWSPIDSKSFVFQISEITERLGANFDNDWVWEKWVWFVAYKAPPNRLCWTWWDTSIEEVEPRSFYICVLKSFRPLVLNEELFREFLYYHPGSLPLLVGYNSLWVKQLSNQSYNKTNCLTIAKQKFSYIIPYIYKTGKYSREPGMGIPGKN